MVKVSEVCAKYNLDETTVYMLISLKNIKNETKNDVMYVDVLDFLDKTDLNTPQPNLFNFSISDLIYFEYIGLFDVREDSTKSIQFLYSLRMFIEKFGNNYEIYSLMEYTSLMIFENDNEINQTFVGLGGKYKEYLSILIDSINKIDLSTIDFTDVMNFELSDEKKILTTQKINVVGSKPNQKTFSFGEEDFINYLFHILPQYLPSNVKFHPSIVGIINDDEDDISIEFKDLMWDKSYDYLMGMKNKVNKVDFSKIDFTKLMVS